MHYSHGSSPYLTIARRVLVAIALVAVPAGSASSGGFLSDVFVRPFSPSAADALDDVHREFKRANPLYGELEDAGSAAVRTALSISAAPALIAAIEGSRLAALSDGVERIPDQIRQSLEGFVPDQDLNAVRWRVGSGGDLSLQQNSFKYGDAAAIALKDVVVFKSREDALYNPGLWAHEMRHIMQYRQWGIAEFARRYIESSNSVERDAEDFAARWAARSTVQVAQNNPGVDPTTEAGQAYLAQPAVEINAPFSSGNMCGTAMGQCQMPGSAPAGTPCWCDTPYGASIGSISASLSNVSTGNMCSTWLGSCQMMDATPQGSPCACASQQGPIPGQVFAQNNMPPPPLPATMCMTQMGSCWMAQAIPIGSSCYCPGQFGPVWGFAR